MLTSVVFLGEMLRDAVDVGVASATVTVRVIRASDGYGFDFDAGVLAFVGNPGTATDELDESTLFTGVYGFEFDTDYLVNEDTLFLLYECGVENFRELHAVQVRARDNYTVQIGAAYDFESDFLHLTAALHSPQAVMTDAVRATFTVYDSDGVEVVAATQVETSVHGIFALTEDDVVLEAHASYTVAVTIEKDGRSYTSLMALATV